MLDLLLGVLLLWFLPSQFIQLILLPNSLSIFELCWVQLTRFFLFLFFVGLQNKMVILLIVCSCRYRQKPLSPVYLCGKRWTRRLERRELSRCVRCMTSKPPCRPRRRSTMTVWVAKRHSVSFLTLVIKTKHLLLLLLSFPTLVIKTKHLCLLLLSFPTLGDKNQAPPPPLPPFLLWVIKTKHLLLLFLLLSFPTLGDKDQAPPPPPFLSYSGDKNQAPPPPPFLSYSGDKNQAPPPPPPFLSYSGQ